VVAGIKAYIEREGVAEDIAIAALDSIYKDDSSSAANMVVVWMQDMGLLKRSVVARGKQKAALE
jgi:deoxyinosine 3'endonuclease (endonuclease V)